MQFLGILLLFTSISFLFDFCYGRIGNSFNASIGNSFNTSKITVAKTIYVDQSGNRDFTKIQDAINAVPANNAEWILIRVASGIYWEKVLIPQNKPFIALYGSGSQTTTIAWGDSDDTRQSCTFEVQADNFVARYIAFKNTYNHNDIVPNRKPAVAALISGDKNSFQHCSFFSLQDTVWDNQGRHYFQSCYIDGAVDFIFGAGQSIYEKVHIRVNDNEVGFPGFITAQGRENATDPNGFVFKFCTVEGNGKVYLGRAWRAYSRVLFYKSSMANVVMPAGWDAWTFQGKEGPITYAEVGNYGPGADTSQRVPWEKKLSDSDVYQLINRSFIDTEDWIDQQP